MTRLLRALRGREVTVAPYRAVLGSREAAATVVGEASQRLRPEFIDRVKPFDSADLLRPDLHRNRAETMDDDQHLTLRQARLWEWLSGLPAATVQLKPRPDLLETSPAAERAVQYESVRLAAAVQLHQVDAELARGEEHRRELDGKLESAEAELESFRARLRELEAALKHARGELDRARKTLDSVLRSRSWRMTAPLRRGRRSR
jgi:hypothetical protein